MPFTVDHQRDVAFSIMAFWAGMKDPSQARKEAEDLAKEVGKEIKEKGEQAISQVAQRVRDKINQLMRNFKSWLLGSVNDFIEMMKSKLRDLLPQLATWPELFDFKFDFNLEQFIPDFSGIFWGHRRSLKRVRYGESRRSGS